jgi:hypothetical protein
MDDYEPPEAERQAVIAEQRALGAFGEAWANEWPAFIADDFVQRLQADFVRRFPSRK